MGPNSLQMLSAHSSAIAEPPQGRRGVTGIQRAVGMWNWLRLHLSECCQLVTMVLPQNESWWGEIHAAAASHSLSGARREPGPEILWKSEVSCIAGIQPGRWARSYPPAQPAVFKALRFLLQEEPQHLSLLTRLTPDSSFTLIPSYFSDSWYSTHILKYIQKQGYGDQCTSLNEGCTPQETTIINSLLQISP